MELNGLPLDNTKKKRTEPIVLPVYIALSYVMIWTFVKNCLLLQPPKEQNRARCEASGQRSCWQPLYVSACASQRGQCRGGSCSAGAGGRGCASTRQPLGGTQRVGAGGARSHPRLMQHKGAAGKTLYSEFPTFFFFFFPSVAVFFPHFPSIMLAREALFLAAPRAPRRSVESRVCKAEFVVPVPGSRAPPRPGPSRQRGVPGPAGQPGRAAPLHPWLLPEGQAPSARPLLLLPRPLPSEARAELRAAVAVPKLLPERLPVGSYGSGRTESSRQCQGDICFPLASL